MIFFTEKSVLSESKFVAGYKLPTASNASKTIDVVDFIPRSHDEIIFAEVLQTFRTLGTEQPV